MKRPVPFPVTPKQPPPSPNKNQLSVNPPNITLRDGEDFSLEVRAAVSGDHYGYGWLQGEGVLRKTKFNLRWRDRPYYTHHHIRKDDIATITIADLEKKTYSRKLRVWGNNGAIHEDEEWGKLSHYRPHPTQWIQIRVVIRARKAEGSWENRYRFRLVDRDTFEVEEIA